jgi:predicted lipoprotein
MALTVGFSRANLLKGFATCATTEIAALRERVVALDDAVQTYAQDLGPETRREAQLAWANAMDKLQQVELFQFGPAATRAQPGGQDLRTELYSWPQFNRCLTDQVLVAGAYADGALSTQLASARGMAALEYLLFYEGTENGCLSGNVINSSGKWDALVADGLAEARASFAAAASSDLRSRTDLLVSAWATADGNFWTELATAGHGSSTYATEQDGLNAVSDALFYIDTETKDMKVGGPLGRFECALSCSAESPFSGRSKFNVRNNLIGFRAVFLGCEAGGGIGFDDLLRNVGGNGPSIADDIGAWLEASIAAIDAIEAPNLETAIAQDAASVERLHDALIELTALLKADFLTALNLAIPMSADGDNDS